MLDYLYPDQHYKNIYSIDFQQLKEDGIKGIICDIDNTIVAWNEKVVMKELSEWFQGIQDTGFRVCLISNGMNSRVDFFSRELNIPAVGQAVKPGLKAYKRAMKILKLDCNQITVIGDQIFTDILGGNRMGFKTILVDPIDENEFITTKILRLVENLVFNRGGY